MVQQEDHTGSHKNKIRERLIFGKCACCGEPLSTLRDRCLMCYLEERGVLSSHDAARLLATPLPDFIGATRRDWSWRPGPRVVA